MASFITGELSTPPTKRHQPEAVVNEKHNVFEKYAIPEMLCKHVVTFFSYLIQSV
jgi:hypothetical protein